MVNVIITDAGLAEIVNAENNGTAPVLLSAVALGTGKYTPAAGQTALQAEFKRITDLSGRDIGDNIINISFMDSSNDSYNVYEVGVFTDNGTLFAVCSQTTPILQKAAVSRAGFALDIALTNINPESITFGDTNFLMNSATTEQQGIVELATEAEAKAGTDTHRAVTPKALDVTIEGHDNIVHRSGGETISGSKTFTKDITVNAPATSAPTGVKINDTNGKGTGYLAQYYAGNEYYTRVMCKNNTSGKSAHIDVKINDDGTSMFSPSVDVMCAPSVSESDKSAKVATTEWVSNKVAKYLPLTGGTISGTIFTSGSGSPVLSVKKGDLNGGRIFLFAPDDADFLGGIVLRAYNSDNTRFVDLTIKSDNTMTWNGKNIVRSVNNVNANAAGNVNISKVQSADKADKLSTARNIALTGLASGSASFDGSGDVTINTKAASIEFYPDSSNSFGGFIDFHYSGSSDDFTARIIEDAKGVISVTAENGFRCNGKHIVRTVNNKSADSSGTVTITIDDISGLKSKLKSFLPLSGGAMTGGNAIWRNVETGALSLYGGVQKGARLDLAGTDHATMPGYFQVRASDGTNTKYLLGKPNGTLTWDDKYILNNSFLMPSDTGAINLTAGTSATGGAYFRLYGKDNASGEGQFSIAATNGTNTKALTGKPGGSLIWDGKEVERVIASNFSGSNFYIKYASGLIIQGGYATAAALSTVTLPVAFSNSNYVVQIQPLNNTGHTFHMGVDERTTTNFKIHSYDGGVLCPKSWLAIGY